MSARIDLRFDQTRHPDDGYRSDTLRTLPIRVSQFESMGRIWKFSKEISFIVKEREDGVLVATSSDLQMWVDGTTRLLLEDRIPKYLSYLFNCFAEDKPWVSSDWWPVRRNMRRMIIGAIPVLPKGWHWSDR